jgi:hypothetical protein
LGLPDLFGVFLTPLLAKGDYFVSVKLVVLTLGSAYAIRIFFRPPLLVFGYLFFMVLIVLSPRLDPMGRFALAFSYSTYRSLSVLDDSPVRVP